MQSGASLVEAGLALPILLALIYGIIELARCFWIFAVLNWAAYQGADLASKLDIGISPSINNVDCSLEGSDNECVKLAGMLRDIKGRVTSVMDWINHSSRIKFVQYDHYDPNSDAYTIPPTLLNQKFLDTIHKPDYELAEMPLAIVRPTEEVLIHNAGPLDLPFSNPCRGPTQGWPAQKGAWDLILSTCPTIIRITADVKPLIPFPMFSSYRVQATQIAYRLSPYLGVANVALSTTPADEPPAGPVCLHDTPQTPVCEGTTLADKPNVDGSNCKCKCRKGYTFHSGQGPFLRQDGTYVLYLTCCADGSAGSLCRDEKPKPGSNYTPVPDNGDPDGDPVDPGGDEDENGPPGEEVGPPGGEVGPPPGEVGPPGGEIGSPEGEDGGGEEGR